MSFAFAILSVFRSFGLSGIRPAKGGFSVEGSGAALEQTDLPGTISSDSDKTQFLSEEHISYALYSEDQPPL